MSGSIALKISIKMNSTFNQIRRGLTETGEAITSFGGYLEALKDVALISESENVAFMREFVKQIINYKGV